VTCARESACLALHEIATNEVISNTALEALAK